MAKKKKASPKKKKTNEDKPKPPPSFPKWCKDEPLIGDFNDSIPRPEYMDANPRGMGPRRR